MGALRILVVVEESRASREHSLTVFDHAVAFEFLTPAEVSGGEVDFAAYSAVVATLESAGPALMESLKARIKAGPPVLLFREEPPLHEVARWIAWAGPKTEGDPSVTGRLLSESLEYYSLASLYQQCLRIMTSQDEEKLLAQITDTFIHELGGESCVIWLASSHDPDEMMIASVRGLLSIGHEGSRFFLSQSDFAEFIWKGKPFSPPAPAKPETEAQPAGEGGTVLYVPLLYNEAPIGLVKMGERMSRKHFGERDCFIARIIADYAASSLKTIDRMSRMEKISLRDPETKAYSTAFLKDYFEKELYKAGRFRRPLSVIFLVVSNFTYLMEKTRESLVVGALSGMVEEIRKALRDSDLIARLDADRFCIVLPETDYFGAMLAVRRLRKVAKERNPISFLGTEFHLQPFFMSSTYPRDGKTFQDLRRVAEENYTRQQKSAFYRLRLQEKSFWDGFDVLVGKLSYYDRLRSGEDVPYFTRIRRDLGRNGHFALPRETFSRIVESVAQDVVSSKNERGLVIAAGPRPEVFRQIFLSFGNESPSGAKIYLVGQTGSTRFDARNLLYVSAEDERLKDREILLYLRENGAYGLFASDRGDDVCGFNTADEWLVEAMMEKIQELYLLQGHF